VVAGGKYTTYRVMAKDTIDAAVGLMSADVGRRVSGCCTQDVPLLGADGYEALWNQRRAIAKAHGLTVPKVEHLLNRFGSLATEVLDLLESDPGLAEPLTGAEDYLRAEIVYAASHEGALHLEDVIARRTRISFETFDRGTQVAREVAALMSGVLRWSSEQREREVDHYLKRVQAERESQTMPDDETADAARMGAPDVVPVAAKAL
jgi:glycerol-3-phosphate dehydrogenase